MKTMTMTPRERLETVIRGGHIMMPSDHVFHTPKEDIAIYAQAVRDLCNYP
jgi:hypothetical protein